MHISSRFCAPCFGQSKYCRSGSMIQVYWSTHISSTLPPLQYTIKANSIRLNVTCKLWTSEQIYMQHVHTPICKITEDRTPICDGWLVMNINEVVGMQFKIVVTNVPIKSCPYLNIAPTDAMPRLYNTVQNICEITKIFSEHASTFCQQFACMLSSCSQLACGLPPNDITYGILPW